MRIGFVCGLADERRIIEQRADGGGEPIAVSGADPARALVVSRKLIAEGARGLVSFGLAAGLDPRLVPGALIVGYQVVTRERTYTGERTWSEELVRQLRGELQAVHETTVFGADLPIQSPRHKETLFNEYGAAVADMESGAVAQACHEAGIPFIVVRAVADDADSTVPDYAAEAIEDDGTADVLSVLGGLALDPLSLPDLIDIAAGARHAYAALRQAAPFVHAPAVQQ